MIQSPEKLIKKQNQSHVLAKKSRRKTLANHVTNCVSEPLYPKLSLKNTAWPQRKQLSVSHAVSLKQAAGNIKWRGKEAYKGKKAYKQKRKWKPSQPWMTLTLRSRREDFEWARGSVSDRSCWKRNGRVCVSCQDPPQPAAPIKHYI